MSLLDVTCTTWFGSNLEYVHGIQIIPVTPATGLLLEPSRLRTIAHVPFPPGGRLRVCGQVVEVELREVLLRHVVTYDLDTHVPRSDPLCRLKELFAPRQGRHHLLTLKGNIEWQPAWHLRPKVQSAMHEAWGVSHEKCRRRNNGLSLMENRQRN